MLGKKKMKTEIKKNIDNIDWNKVSALFESVGWGRRDPDKLKRAFKSSQVVVFILSAGNLIGIGRALTDFEFYATIFDVIVLPEYQGNGYGRMIIENLLKPLQGLRFVHLTSMPDKVEFYKKFEFRKQKTAMVIMEDPSSEFAEKILE